MLRCSLKSFLFPLLVLSLWPFCAVAEGYSPFSTKLLGQLRQLLAAPQGSEAHLYFRGLHGIDRVTLRRDDSVLGTNLQRAHSQNAALFRGTVKKAGRTSPVAGDLIGARLRLRYLDVRGRPVSIAFNLTSSRRTPEGKREATSKYRRLPCGGGDVASAIVTNSAKLAATGTITEILPVLSPPRTLQISTFGDYEFFSQYGESSKAEMQAIINAVSVNYTAELGIALQVVDQPLFRSPGEPSVATTAFLLLQDFRDAALRLSSQSFGDTMHLFTGKNLDGAVVGLSYIGEICQDQGLYSYGLSQRVSDSIQWIVTAHEIGHNLNAQHTEFGEGIMSPAIAPEFSSFASQSLKEISRFVLSHGDCLAYEGNSVSLIGNMVSGSRLRVIVSAAGKTKDGCTLELYGSRYRPKRAEQIHSGRLLATRNLPLGRKLSWSFPLIGSSRNTRKFYLAARLSCPTATNSTAVGTSQSLTAVSTNSSFLTTVRRRLKL